MFHTITIAHRKRIYFIKVGENEKKQKKNATKATTKNHRKGLRNAETHQVLKDIDQRSETHSAHE